MCFRGHAGHKGILHRFACALIVFLVAYFSMVQVAVGKSGTFDFAQVVEMAKRLADRQMEVKNNLPPELNALDYDAHRGIRFRPKKAVWGGQKSNFSIQLFHRGWLFKDKVNIHLVEEGGVKKLSYRPELFQFDTPIKAEKLPADLGFAGFRVHYPLNRKDYADELIVFLGASYFRALSRGQVYGASARGLAVDVATDRAEEFPVFTDFWVERPDPGADTLTIIALMESTGATGAYCFTVRPGAPTCIDVRAELFPRHEAKKFGLAPLTSMFYYDQRHPRPRDDYRPEVHDSDGLLITQQNGEWLWRPLDNPEKVRVSRFQTEGPVGFGLIQRDRDFDHYRDMEAMYHRRPSIWVQPGRDWPAGVVELLEIPTDNEFADNVVAYWVPADGLFHNKSVRLSYRLSFPDGDPEAHRGGKCVARYEVPAPDGQGQRFILDFAGDGLESLPAGAKLESVIRCSTGKAVSHGLQKNGDNRHWRLIFDYHPEGSQTADIRVFLKHDNDVLTETWSGQWRKL